MDICKNSSLSEETLDDRELLQHILAICERYHGIPAHSVIDALSNGAYGNKGKELVKELIYNEN